MSTRQARIWLLSVGLILAACGAEPAETGAQLTTTTALPTPTEAPTTSISSPLVSGEPLDVIVLPDENGEFPPDLIVTCPSGPSFPIEALDDIAPLDSPDPTGMQAAIEPFLTSEEGQFWPQDGWQVLHRTSQEAILVVTTQEGNLAYMFLDFQDGEWVWSGSSINGNPCTLQYTIPEGLNTVEWRLDPSAPSPGTDSTTIEVLLTERECVSGQEIGDRLMGPQVVMTDTAVWVAFAAEPPPGEAFECQGNPETAFTVDLPQPLGDREIIEGMSVGLDLEDYVR